MGFLTNRTLWGADLPPLVKCLAKDIFNIFFNRGLVYHDIEEKNKDDENKTNLMGGRSAPPSCLAIGYFQYSFLTGVLSWM